MIEIQRTGSSITIVDMGRFGFRKYGVPVSGAMDLLSAASANSILSNPIGSAVLEMYLSGHQFTIHQDTRIAFAGAEAEIKINDQRIYNNQIINITKGTNVFIGAVKRGSRLYIAVEGGFDTKTLMGSKSPLFGYFPRTLYKGDKIPILENVIKHLTSSNIKSIVVDKEKVIDCTPGPEWTLLTKSDQQKFLSNKYKISHDSNRMGFRLSGKVVKLKKSEILSSAVLPGTVQLLPNGLPIILMRDCQTTGGYPRVLQITDADINQIAQRRPGDPIQFCLT